MLQALWPLGRGHPLLFTHHEEDSNSLVEGGLVQEVTEHEQVVYGARALDRGPVRNDTSEPSPTPRQPGRRSGMGHGFRSWEGITQGLQTAFSLMGHTAIS